jgi:hypothetical protein
VIKVKVDYDIHVSGIIKAESIEQLYETYGVNSKEGVLNGIHDEIEEEPFYFVETWLDTEDTEPEMEVSAIELEITQHYTLGMASETSQGRS